MATHFQNEQSEMDLNRDDSTFFHMCSNLNIRESAQLPVFNQKDLCPDFIDLSDPSLHSILLKFQSALTNPKLFGNLSMKQEFCDIHVKMKKSYVTEKGEEHLCDLCLLVDDNKAKKV